MMKQNFSLHPRLSADCHELGQLGQSRLLLLNNAHYKWFILVPEVTVDQIHLLTQAEREALQGTAQQLSEVVESLYEPQRINVGALGNLVPQLHYHVVARHPDDPAWPGPVWGHPETTPFTEEQVEAIKTALLERLPLQ